MRVQLSEVTTNDARQPTFKAFGEMKTLREWLADVRCVVDRSTLEKRIFRGWELQDALATPKGDSLGFDRKVSAFGEEKTFEEWGADTRRHVPLTVIRTRLGNGWTAEEAISTPAPGKAKGLKLVHGVRSKVAKAA